MRRIHAAAVAVALTAGTAALPVAVQAAGTPAAVHAVAEYQSGRHSWVTWANPRSSFARVIVRLAKGRTAPASPTSGRSVAVSRAKAHSARLPHLAAASAYTVAIWTRSASGSYSKRATSTFSTQPHAQTGTIAGTVTDRQGHQLAGVHVEAESGARTTTDAHGHYALHVPTGPASILFDGSHATGGLFDATGYVDADADRIVHPGKTVTADRKLAGGGAVSVRFLDSAGQPLAGVEPDPALIAPFVQSDLGGVGYLVFFESDGQVPRGSGADGRLTLRGVPAGAFLLCSDAGTAQLAGGVSHDYTRRCAPMSTDVAAGQHADVGDVTLYRDTAGVLTGTVRDPHGHPLTHVAVEVSTQRADVPSFAITDAHGRYRVSGLANGTYRACVDPASNLTRRALAADQLSCSASVSVSAGHTAPANVRMHPGGAVAGRVTTTTGVPISRALVEITSPKGDYFAYADSSGYYRLLGMRPGHYRICFDAQETTRVPTGALRRCVHSVAVRAGYTRIGVDPQLKLGGAISGRVTDRSGKPLADVDVLAFRGSNDDNPTDVTSDRSGHYRITGLRSGTYEVCFLNLADGPGASSGPCQPSRKVTVRAGHTVTHVDVRLAAGSSGFGAITVTARDAHGNPISGVDAVALATCTRPPGLPFDPCDHEPLFGNKASLLEGSDITGPDGSVTLDYVDPGRYAVCLFAYDGATTVDRSPTGYADACTGTTFSVTVTAGQTAHVTQVLQPGGAVIGRVTDAQGHPVGGVHVVVANSGASDYAVSGASLDLGSFLAPEPRDQAVTNPDGTYEVHGVQPGSQSVCVPATKGYQRACTTAASTAGTVTSGVDLTLTR